MSVRRRGLHARLDRLSVAIAKMPPAQDRGPDFPIDPLIARALRDDHLRFIQLMQVSQPNGNSRPRTPAEAEEMSKLGASIAERARAIGCVPGYGLQRTYRDEDRLDKLHYRRMSPPSCGGEALTSAEDIEEVQL